MKKYIIGILMMLPSINMMSAAANSTAVKSDVDIEDIPSDTIPALSKRELRRQRVAKRNLHYNAVLPEGMRVRRALGLFAC